MHSALILLAVSALIASLFARPLRSWHLQAPLVLVAAGLVAGQAAPLELADLLNSEITQHTAEMILAVLLFLDATRMRRGKIWGDDPRSVARLLLLALPLSLGAAMGLGFALLPDFPWPALLVIACVVMPIDLAPASWILQDRRISGRARATLNVEGGFNDGIISPLFLFGLALTGAGHSAADPFTALMAAIPASLMALLIGAAIGAVIATLIRFSETRGWMDGLSTRTAVLLIPILTFLAAVPVGANGFVASFISGVAVRFVLDRGEGHREMSDAFRLVNDASHVLSLLMWFVFGNVAVYVLQIGVGWQIVAFSIAALTVLRLVPVLVALTPSRFSPRERVQIGLLGPRGTTTIVFGLLAFNGLPNGDPADTAIAVMTMTVLGSVVLHNLAGLAIPSRLRRLRRRAPAPE